MPSTLPVRTLGAGAGALTVSAIGLGCMGMSEFYGASDEAGGLSALERAVELGVSFLDTADMYGAGDNERLLGRFLRGHRRDQITLATKFGILRSGDPNARPIDSSPEYARRACEASLKRLGVETIDLYYLHRRDTTVPIEDTVGAMGRLVTEGKVRALGLCEVSPWTLRLAHATHPITALQSEWSLWSRDVESLLPTLRELGIGLVPYSPLGRGALTGAMSSADELAPDDFRHGIPRYASGTFERNLESVALLRRIGEEHDATPAQVALAWLLAQGPDVVPIPGTRRAARVEENAAAAALTLDATELEALDEGFAPGSIEGARTGAVAARLVDQ